MICAHNIKLTKNKTKIKAKHISFRSPISAAMKIEFASSIILAALSVSHAALRGSSNVESKSAIPASAAAGASTIIRPELKNGKGTKNWPPKPTVSCPAGCFQAGPKTDGEIQKQCEDEDGNTGTQNCSMASIYCSCEGGGHAEYREVCNDCITGGGFGPGKTETPEGDDSFGGGDLDGISSF